jgi:purine-cytosine permease-like protein
MAQGVNDVTIATGIILFFLILGFIMPYVNAEFSQPGQTVNSEQAYESIKSPSLGTATLSALASLLAWTIYVPDWLNLTLFLAMRIAMYFIIARNIWIGGGG